MFSGVLDAICTKHGAGCVSRRISTSGPGQALYATLNLPADAAKALQAEAAEKGGFLIVPLPLSLELIPLQLLAPQWQPQSGDEPVERTFRVGGATGGNQGDAAVVSDSAGLAFGPVPVHHPLRDPGGAEGRDRWRPARRPRVLPHHGHRARLVAHGPGVLCLV